MRLIQALVTERIDARAMGVTRAAVGVAALVMTLEIGGYLSRLADPALIRLPVIEPLETMLLAAWPIALLLWVVAAAAFTVGLLTPLAGGSLVGIGVVFMASDQQLYSNHLYLAVTVVAILTLAGAGNGFAIRPSGTDGAARWGRVRLKFQVSVVYGFSALAKLKSSYLSGSVMASYLRSDGPLAVPQQWRTFDAMLVLSIVAVLAEALLAIGLWLPKWRRNAFVVGLGLHAIILLTFDPPLPFLAFGILTLGLYVQFLDAPPASRLVIWDRSCSFCASSVAWARRLDWLGALRFEGNDDVVLLAAHDITPQAADEAMHVVDDAATSAGFDAVRRIAEVLPISFLWAPLLGLPPVRFVGDRVYREVARRRHCRIGPVQPAGAMTNDLR
jgi:predicted DCC family thiol-disulfide oxidoreductase YuxK